MLKSETSVLIKKPLWISSGIHVHIQNVCMLLETQVESKKVSTLTQKHLIIIVHPQVDIYSLSNSLRKGDKMLG